MVRQKAIIVNYVYGKKIIICFYALTICSSTCHNVSTLIFSFPQDETIDVVALGSGSEGPHIRALRPSHERCSPHYETPSEGSCPTIRRKGRRRLHRRRRHDTPDGTESSSEDDSDKWDSENEGLVTSPDNTDSGSDESEDSEEERIAQLGSEYEDVSEEEESDVEMPSDQEEEEEDEDEEDIYDNGRHPHRGRRRHSEGDESSSRDDSFEERFSPRKTPRHLVKRLKRHHMSLKQVCASPLKGSLLKDQLPRIDEDKAQSSVLTSPMKKSSKIAVEVVRTDEGAILERLPPSPASDHLPMQDARRSPDEYFLGESNMETEIYDCRRFLPHPHGMGG